MLAVDSRDKARGILSESSSDSLVEAEDSFSRSKIESVDVLLEISLDVDIEEPLVSPSSCFVMIEKISKLKNEQRNKRKERGKKEIKIKRDDIIYR